jgi:hypothetical protein
MKKENEEKVYPSVKINKKHTIIFFKKEEVQKDIQ